MTLPSHGASMDTNHAFDIYTKKALDVYRVNEHPATEDGVIFSDFARSKAIAGDWNPCARELRDQLNSTLASVLSEDHSFEAFPYVREISLPRGKKISVAVVNQQSREWYGGQDVLGSFDFVAEDQLGAFTGCRRFLDLGGHQLIWSIYYALTASTAKVTAFEPSILNVLIGLFNCLVNGVVDRVQVVPYAVVAEGADEVSHDSDKMLVDFMTVPLKARPLSESSNKVFDFVKVDIEGYEYELLSDRLFLDILSKARKTHFELHLGHLIKRNVTRENCVAAMKSAKLEGIELHSQKEMYAFLDTCDRNGYYSFLLN